MVRRAHKGSGPVASPPLDARIPAGSQQGHSPRVVFHRHPPPHTKQNRNPTNEYPSPVGATGRSPWGGALARNGYPHSQPRKEPAASPYLSPHQSKWTARLGAVRTPPRFQTLDPPGLRNRAAGRVSTLVVVGLISNQRRIEHAHQVEIGARMYLVPVLGPDHVHRPPGQDPTPPPSSGPSLSPHPPGCS